MLGLPVLFLHHWKQTFYLHCIHRKKKWSHFDLKNWVTSGSKIWPGIPSNFRIFESNWLDIESNWQFDSQYRVNLTQIIHLIHQWLNFLGQNDFIFFFQCSILLKTPAAGLPVDCDGLCIRSTGTLQDIKELLCESLEWRAIWRTLFLHRNYIKLGTKSECFCGN